MTIAIWAGAAGVGKTAVLGITAQFFAAQQNPNPLLAIDANPDQLLLEYEGVDEHLRLTLKELAAPESMEFLKHALESNNPFYAGKLDKLYPTSPVTDHSGFWKVAPDDPIMQAFALEHLGIYFMHTGSFSAKNAGVSCSHDLIGSLIFMLQRLDDGPQGENANVLIDYAHGEDGFGTPLYPQSDIIVVVTEPTPKSIGITGKYLQIGAQIADDIGRPIDIAVIGNKLSPDADKRNAQESRLRDVATHHYIGGLRRDDALDRDDQITAVTFDSLMEPNREAIAALAHRIKDAGRDPVRKQAWLKRVHAEVSPWYDRMLGTDGEIAEQYERADGHTCGSSGCTNPHHNHGPS